MGAARHVRGRFRPLVDPRRPGAFHNTVGYTIPDPWGIVQCWHPSCCGLSTDSAQNCISKLDLLDPHEIRQEGTVVPLYDETRHPCYNCHFPYAVVGLILTNVFVFILELINGPDWAIQYALVPYLVVHGVAVWTVFTSMFIHAGWLHLIGNMIYLWVFGDELDRYVMGSWRFLTFYLLCGLAATALQVAVDPSLRIPNLGASGAIAGVLAGFLVVFPRDEILTLFLVPIPIPVRLSALILIGFWFLFQLASSLLSIGSTGDGGVAYFAHVGGFVAGFLLVRLFATPPPRAAAGGRV